MIGTIFSAKSNYILKRDLGLSFDFVPNYICSFFLFICFVLGFEWTGGLTSSEEEKPTASEAVGLLFGGINFCLKGVFKQSYWL